jgi:hypothetical protein
MCHPRFGWAVVLGLLALFVPASRAPAQVGGVGADPFSFYYGYYLPHQAAIAAQPSPLDTINAITAARQQNALADRPSLYDPISPYGDDQDLLDPFSRRGQERLTKLNGAASNARGTGPAGYYGRTGRYHPTLRSGRGPNRNIAVARYSRFGGLGGGGGGGGPNNPSFGMGAMGMPSMPGMGGMGMPSMPGPR